MKKQNLFYARIPKCANSTIALTLASHAVGDCQDSSGEQAKLAFNMWPTPSEFDKARKFTLVREPVERIVSAWKDKGMNPKWIARHQYAGDSITRPSLRQFLYSMRENNFFKNAHFLPQVHMIPGDRDSYKIGTLETLEADLKSLCLEIFGSFHTLVEKKHGRTDAKSYLDQISEEESELIQQLYADDIDFYRNLVGSKRES